ncbi:hypothetical protein [Actinocorallia longicatena]|uniref:Uncharacterized protein n=1 Tax=Actinocorallia longicatena TaxID=111803 RepID=A0ABP6Q0Y5_9ACTN
MFYFENDGSTKALTEPNEIRHVGREVVKAMYPEVEDASKRRTHQADVTKVASWDHRKL